MRESRGIHSFYLTPAPGGAILPFKPGQFLTIRARPDGADQIEVRPYTVSSAPSDPEHRISVWCDVGGSVSRHLLDHIAVGDVIGAKGPNGAFDLDTTATRPAVLLSAGDGVTSMISMARAVASEGTRTRHTRPPYDHACSQTVEDRAFTAELQALSGVSGGKVR